MSEYIMIKNKNGLDKKWEIIDEENTYYKIRYEGYVTTINKLKVFVEDGKIKTNEIRKTEFDKNNFAIASFGIVRIDG